MFDRLGKTSEKPHSWGGGASTTNPFPFLYVRGLKKISRPALTTVKHVLSGHRIKRRVAEVPKFISLIYFKCNLY